MNYTITQATPETIPHMLPLLKQLFSVETDFSYDDRKHARALGLIIDDVMSDVAVIRMGDTVVGMATMQPTVSSAEGGSVGIIEDVVVDEAHRRKGLGRMLIDYLLTRAEVKGFAAVKLLADKTNTPALHFYKDRRFSQTQLIMLRKKMTP